MSTRHLVVIEGQHAGGKTTQTEAVARALRALGLDAQAWHHARQADASNRFSAALVYAHQRAELFAWAEREGPDVLLVDRWWHSTEVVAWTCANRERSALYRLAVAEKGLHLDPTLVLALDAPDEVLDARILERGAAVTDTDRLARPWYRDETVLRAWGAHRVDTSGDTAATTARLTAMVLAALGRVDDAIDLWHETPTPMEAHDWLGMSWDAYRAGVVTKRGPR